MVDSLGLVTARKSGKETITATGASNPEAKATCEVTVIQPVEGVALSDSAIVITELGMMKQLTARALPDDATEKGIKWLSSNIAVCTVSDNGTVVATGYGKATVVATTIDGSFPGACVVLVNKNGVDADVNGDGVVDVADIATIISEMAARARMQKETEE